MDYCGNCGNKLKLQGKYCDSCGQAIKANEQIITPLIVESPQGSSNQTNSWIIGIVATLLICAVVLGIFVFRNDLKPLQNKILMSLGVTKQEPVTIVQTPTVIENQKTDSISTGLITGNDVILRSAPSISATELDYLQRGQIVKIINKEESIDPNAAVLTEARSVNYNGQVIQLQRGQVVDIMSSNGNEYRVRVKINNQWISGLVLTSSQLRKIHGDIWYQVNIDNSKTGWVFGAFVAIKQYL